MTKINITQAVLAVARTNEADLIIKEVKSTDLFSLQRALKEANRLIDDRFRVSLGTTHLMAAAGESLTNWFSQPIVFDALGMYVDIRKVVNSGNKVEVFAEAIEGKREIMHSVFAPYANTELTFELKLNGESVLKAELFVTQDATFIEGNGELANQEMSPVGDLELFIHRKESL